MTRLAYLLANGKLMYIYWLIVADDFHVTNWNFGEFPVDFSRLSSAQRIILADISTKLESTMIDALQFKLNAGRRIGNYNLAKCRHITDQSDCIFTTALGFENVRDDIELYYAQTVKTDFTDEITD